MFETSDKHYQHVVSKAGASQPNAALTASQLSSHSTAGLVETHQQQLLHLEEKEVELKKQEQEILASKERVFAKWQDYLERSERIETRDIELQRFSEQLKVKEQELEQKQRLIEEKEAALGKIKMQINSSGDDSMHSVFFISDKEA